MKYFKNFFEYGDQSAPQSKMDNCVMPRENPEGVEDFNFEINEVAYTLVWVWQRKKNRRGSYLPEIKIAKIFRRYIREKQWYHGVIFRFGNAIKKFLFLYIRVSETKLKSNNTFVGWT